MVTNLIADTDDTAPVLWQLLSLCAQDRKHLLTWATPSCYERDLWILRSLWILTRVQLTIESLKQYDYVLRKNLKLVTFRPFTKEFYIVLFRRRTWAFIIFHVVVWHLTHYYRNKFVSSDGSMIYSRQNDWTDLVFIWLIFRFMYKLIREAKTLYHFFHYLWISCINYDILLSE